MSIYISDAIVAGDTSVSASAGVGAMGLVPQGPLVAAGISTPGGVGALAFSGLSAESAAGMSPSPGVGALSFGGLSAENAAGISAGPGVGSFELRGVQGFAVARGRVVIVSNRMVLQRNPPTPSTCVSGTIRQKGEVAGRLVEEFTLHGYYQANNKDCE